MRKILLLPILCLFTLSILVLGKEPGDKRQYVVIEGVQVLNGNKPEALFYFQNNWAKLRKKAVKKKMIASFELIESTKNEDGADIYLITRFENKKQFDDVEKNFQVLIKAHGDLKLLNNKKPVDFRKSMFSSTGRVE